jgi:hypothetical protein
MVYIVLGHMSLAYIVLYCQEPNILPVWQYISYVARDLGFPLRQLKFSED